MVYQSATACVSRPHPLRLSTYCANRKVGAGAGDEGRVSRATKVLFLPTANTMRRVKRTGAFRYALPSTEMRVSVSMTSSSLVNDVSDKIYVVLRNLFFLTRSRFHRSVRMRNLSKSCWAVGWNVYPPALFLTCCGDTGCACRGGCGVHCGEGVNVRHGGASV